MANWKRYASGVLPALVMVVIPLSAHSAEVPMSPAVKTHLCKLAKRDAALTPTEIEKIRVERAECLAERSAAQSELPIVTKCAHWSGSYYGGTECKTEPQVRLPRCPEDYPATAQRRIEKYCTDE